MRKSPRDRRLNSDFESVKLLRAESTIFSFDSAGIPPKQYRMKFRGNGVRRDSNGHIEVCSQHEVLVELGTAYPRMIPYIAWQTPIFHPNISHNGVVCLGGYGTHWVPSLTLSEMCTMLWDMIRFKNFDVDSPYNREAALWAKQQQDYKFPLDARSIRDRISNAPPKPKMASIAKPSSEILLAEVVETTSIGRPARQFIAPGIEIIESGIEIIEPSPARESSDGILFLD